MLNYEEEIRKFKPSLEVEDIEDAVYEEDLTDMQDLLKEVMEKKKKKKQFSSDVRVRDLENQHLDINAKKLSELATIPLGLPYVLIIHGEDEKKADKLLQKYRTVS